MKRFHPFFLILLVLLAFSGGNILYAMGGYSKEVHTSFGSSPGYVLDDSLYFLVNYHLYRKPKGIYRFPDGGMAKTVHQSLYMMRYSADKLQVVEKLSASFSNSKIKATKAVRVDSRLMFIMRPARGSDEQLTFTITQNSVSTNKATAAILAGFEGKEAKKKSITFTSNLIRQYGLAAASVASASIPSPLDYAKKSPKEGR